MASSNINTQKRTQDAWLTSAVLWMNFSNWQSMWKKGVVPLLHKFSQECWKSRSHFMSVMNVVHRPPGFRDKVIYINFFVMSARLTKFENCITYMAEPEISSLVFIFFLSVILIQVAWQSWWQFRSFLFEPRKRTRLSYHRLLVWKFHIFEIYRYVMKPEITFKPTHFWFFTMFTWLIFHIMNLC